jgi:hypothetical protein
MPLSKDPAGGGTEADGTKSGKYCSFCYVDGQFVHPDFTAVEMQDFCIGQLQKKGMPRIVAWMFTRGIPRLERWRH